MRVMARYVTWLAITTLTTVIVAKKKASRRNTMRRLWATARPSPMRRLASHEPIGIRINPAKNTAGMAKKISIPTYGLAVLPPACNTTTNSQEQPAMVTSADPSRLSQWLVRKERTEWFPSIGLPATARSSSIEVGDQSRHFLRGEVRPCQMFFAHLIEHRGAMAGEGRDHG